VGQVFPDVVIYHRLNRDKVWLCVISGGLPFPDQDRIIHVDQAPQALDQVMAYASRIVGSAADAHATLEEALTEFERRRSDRGAGNSHLRMIRLRRVPSRAHRLVYALLPLLLVVILWLGWQVLQAFHARELGQKVSLAALAKSRDAAAVTQAAREQMMRRWQDDIARQRETLEAGIGAVSNRWQQWNAARSNLPLTLAGYQPASLSCDEHRCLAGWVAASAWSRLSDRSRIPGLMPAQKGEQGLQSRMNLPRLSVPHTTAGWKATAGDLQFAMEAATQFIAPELQWTPLQPVVIAAPAGLGLAPEVVGSRGQLRLRLNGPLALIRTNDVVAELAHWPVRLNSVSWSQISSAHPSVDLQAEYVEVAHASR
jgi:hypothetical protein